MIKTAIGSRDITQLNDVIKEAEKFNKSLPTKREANKVNITEAIKLRDSLKREAKAAPLAPSSAKLHEDYKATEDRQRDLLNKLIKRAIEGKDIPSLKLFIPEAEKFNSSLPTEREANKVDITEAIKLRDSFAINTEQQAHLRTLIGDTIYDKLVAEGGIVPDGDGNVVEFRVWNQGKEWLLNDDELDQLTFDIERLKSLPKLTEICLGGTGVTGNIEHLKSLLDLTVIDLSKCNNVKGNLEHLKSLENLTVIDLSRTGVSGDIKHLASLENLTVIYLGRTGVYGDIAHLASLRNLTHIYLYGTCPKKRVHRHPCVYGCIEHLKSLLNLTYIDLGRTGVYGDIAHLASLRNLTHINLDDTGGVNYKPGVPHTYVGSVRSVNGDIIHLASLTELIDIRLRNTAVYGDITHLKSLNELTRIDLSKERDLGKIGDVNIQGDIKDLASLPKLADINLMSSLGEIVKVNIQGDIKDLASLVKLTDINLSGTKVSGNIQDLASLVKLTDIDLGDTSVEGDIEDLKALWK